jgi:uncharacterized protein DUF3551
MRLLLTTLTILAAVICIGKPAEAQNYPWCAYYNYGFGGARNCGFVTYQQCLATGSGVGGPYASEPAWPSRPSRRYYH